MRRSHTHLAARARYARAHTCAPTHTPAAPPAAGVMLDAAVAARLEQGGDSHRHLELSPKRCDSRCNCGMAHVIVGARVAASALSAHSVLPRRRRAAIRRHKLGSSSDNRWLVRLGRVCSPGLKSNKLKKMTPTDLTPLPCSTRAFTYARAWTPELYRTSSNDIVPCPTPCGASAGPAAWRAAPHRRRFDAAAAKTRSARFGREIRVLRAPWSPCACVIGPRRRRAVP